ncbi:Ubiquitinyl_hydrolase 1 [Hexamita inflata]|uniref:ubiquitinyl hydrolase 1 n=1 Tax=Hexamita inflata TaxID=28002 RepID=A0AA86VL02_9EUKA|nr:Ubiquitinyl hydrolase 1 [Hexamita inflata]
MYREPEGTPIFKEECQHCFEQKLSQQGLFLCLFCDHCCCHEHAYLHQQKTSHSEFVRLRYEFRQELSPEELQQKLHTETLEELADLESKVFQIVDGVLQEVVEVSDEQCLTAALIADCPPNQDYRYLKPAADSVSSSTCIHMNLIKYVDGQHPNQKCADCELTKNLWLCLTCGRLSCGRKNWDGTGGNGHALMHATATNHSVALKTTSCCKSTQEVYCYKCDNEVPINNKNQQVLQKLLQQFQLEYILERGTAGELSLLDQVRQNQLNAQKQNANSGTPMKWDMITGLKQVPFENTGNTCYANSVVNALLCFDNTFMQNDHMSKCQLEPEKCFQCQIQRILFHSKKELFPLQQQPHLTNLMLSMKSYLTNRENIGKQQDAQEFLEEVLKKLPETFRLPRTRKEVHCKLCGFRQFSEGTAQNYIGLTCNFFDQVTETEQGMPIDLTSSLQADLFGTQKSVYDFKCKQCGAVNNKDEEQVIRVGQSYVDPLPQNLIVVINRLFYDKVFQKVNKLRTRIENAKEINLSILHPEPLLEEGIEEIMAFGFTFEEAQRALRQANYDKDQAVSLLFDNQVKPATQETDHERLLNKGNQQFGSEAYQLQAFVEHVGQSYDCGHYIAYCKTELGWVKCDDDKFSMVDNDNINPENAYLMFYRKQ